MSRKIRREKKNGNTGYAVTIIILTAVLALCIKHIAVGERIGKFEGYLNEYYYSQEHLEAAMKDTLGDIYGEDAEANFDNYVYKLILDDINRHEPEEIAKYNTVFGIERTKEVTSQLNEAEKVSVAAENGVCTIKISDFTNGRTCSGLMEYRDLLESNRRFIVDLRGNHGGHTSELVEVLSLFYEDGTVVYTETADEVKEYKAVGSKIIDFDRLVFLCDENTASCAEVMIFNIKSDFPDKVSVVGKATYGKYFSCVFKDFSDGYSFVMVSSFMGNGRGETFDGNGIIPDAEAEGEECVEKALEILG